jgi:hypothetical protein
MVGWGGFALVTFLLVTLFLVTALMTAGSHPRGECVDEMLGALADLHRIEADDLIGKPIRHFEQDGGASLGVKLPALIDGAPADELFSQLGNAVLAIFNFSGELPQLQLARLRVVGKSIAAMLGEVLFPRGD